MKYKTHNHWDKSVVYNNLPSLVDRIVDGNSWGDGKLERAERKVEKLTSMLAGLLEVLNLNEAQLSEVLGEKVEIILD